MEFYEVVRTRRSIRSYKADPVPQLSLERVLEAARIAPSGHNRQLWKFYVVKDDEKRRRVAEACGGQTWIAQAPVVIVAVGWKIPFNRGGYMGEMSFMMDVSIAFTHLVLAARAEGLGTCWIGDFDNSKVKEALGLPDDQHVVAVTPLGYPDKQGFTANTKRKLIEEIVEEV
ncbi:MAG TPA: nitroreductase family protein [Candidatus Desulfaltia sp.]|nr:nitroreductase family protein [Candidatus Desulfaltia sp.]